jgi:hypothetical protein
MQSAMLRNELASPREVPFLEASLKDDCRRDLAHVEQLAQWLDSKFEIPGLGIRFGLDAIIGLMPGFGDALTSVLSLYILTIASRYKMPRITQARMAANIAVDWLMGSIPLLGDMFDVAWKANQRNAALLKRHLLATTDAQRAHQRRDWLFLIALIAGLLIVLGIAVTIAYILLRAIWLSLGTSG